MRWEVVGRLGWQTGTEVIGKQSPHNNIDQKSHQIQACSWKRFWTELGPQHEPKNAPKSTPKGLQDALGARSLSGAIFVRFFGGAGTPNIMKKTYRFYEVLAMFVLFRSCPERQNPGFEQQEQRM